MQNLATLIEEALTERRQSKADFCAQLGISRTTLPRWKTSMPTSQTLRAIAEHLDLPYRQVVSAALTGAGYLEDTDSALAAPSVYVVVNNCDPDDSQSFVDAGLPEHGVVGVFTDQVDADRYVSNANRIRGGAPDFRTLDLTVDSVKPLTPIAVYASRWDSASDTIRTTVTYHASIPERFRNARTTDVNAAEFGESGLIDELLADSLDPHAGQALLQSFLEPLRARGRLRPASDELPPTEITYQPPQLLQPIPATFQSFRESLHDAPVEDPSSERDRNIQTAATYIQNRYYGSHRYSAGTWESILEQVDRSSLYGATPTEKPEPPLP